MCWPPLCDLTIASENAQFGQVGPKVGSVDAGWGTAFLARHIGDKRAREMWFINDRYTAKQAQEMGLVNKVVPAAELDAAVKDWTRQAGPALPDRARACQALVQCGFGFHPGHRQFRPACGEALLRHR